MQYSMTSVVATTAGLVDIIKQCSHSNSARISRMHAGSDFLMMPTCLEPCGLVHAMRHISVPVVATTAGLVDTDKSTSIPKLIAIVWMHAGSDFLMIPSCF